MFKIIVRSNYEAVSDEANKLMRQLLTSNAEAVLGLATGSSPIGLYKRMIADFENGITDFRKVITFNLDEYVGLNINHHESYYSFMNRNLFSHINLTPRNINIPIGQSDDLEQECKIYDAEMKKHVIDLQILGLGTNGHIGFNEPMTPFDLETHVVNLTKQTRFDNSRFFNSIDEVPKQAITMGIASILRAKKIVLIACGISKANAIYEMINGEISEQVPATILQRHPDVVVILDEDAASKL
jgi:glucosamine-6-phosphate deaminase